MLARADPERSQHLLELAQADIDERWRYYEQLAGVERSLSAEPDMELGHPDPIHYVAHGDQAPETD